MKYFLLVALLALANARPTPQEEPADTAAPSDAASAEEPAVSATASDAASAEEPAVSADPVPLPTPQPSVALHPNGNAGKCVDVRGGNLNPGTVVQIYDCNGTDAQKLSMRRGDGQVMVAGTNLCLQADTHANGAKNWYYTDDDRLAVTNAGLCLDLTDGSDANGNALQVWQCGDGNTNQVWTTNVLR